MPLKPDLLIWTDGSRHREQGFSGCAVVFGGKLWKNPRLGSFGVSLGVQPSADVAEIYGHIYALRLALWLHETYCPPREKRFFDRVVIVTDSKFTSDHYDFLLFSASPAQLAAAPAIVQEAVGLIRQILKLGVGVEVRWERRDSSHGNREADRLAGVASRIANKGYGVEEWVEEIAVREEKK